MKSLLDQNLSWRLAQQLTDVYPECRHVRDAGLKEADDQEIWEYAEANEFVIVTKDSDFQQRSLLFGHPPKVIRLRVGNCTVVLIRDLLRTHHDFIQAFYADKVKSYLVLP